MSMSEDNKDGDSHSDYFRAVSSDALKEIVNCHSGSRSLEYVDELNNYKLLKYPAFKELVIIII
jgi:hypothetical protein